MMAILPTHTRQILAELAANDRVTIAIVSGRALRDVKGRIGMPELIYAGNHGLEIEGRGLAFEHPGASVLKMAIREITERLAVHTATIEGIEIEAKGLTSSIHFRRANRAAQIHLESIVSDLIAPDDRTIAVRRGKMVVEICPRVDWHKGKAISWIRNQLDQPSALPIVIGDDLTDENAFDAFNDAVTIRVGDERPTGARYRLGGPEEVAAFLAQIDDRSLRPGS